MFASSSGSRTIETSLSLAPDSLDESRIGAGSIVGELLRDRLETDDSGIGESAEDELEVDIASACSIISIRKVIGGSVVGLLIHNRYIPLGDSALGKVLRYML
jgi:hypothetical protein